MILEFELEPTNTPDFYTIKRKGLKVGTMIINIEEYNHLTFKNMTLKVQK